MNGASALPLTPSLPQTEAVHDYGEPLAQGRFHLGWALYENRRRGRGAVFDPVTQWPELRCPEWQGEDVDGKHLLVFLEQGFGDQIMFARYLPLIEARGASVTYICSAELARLFPNGHPARRRQDFAPAHYWALAGSLPLRFGTSLEAIPPPYDFKLHIGNGGGIGVVPSGRPTHENDAQRSLDAENAQRLLSVGCDLRPQATGARDFLDTARIIADLDLVISVDTAIAHLAASMGKETWVLLPAKGCDWRWLRERSDSPWYPAVKLHRQRTTWTEVVDGLQAEIAAIRLRTPQAMG